MTNYASGRRFEYEIRDAFKAEGMSIIRSAGSKGPIDLIAYNENVVWAIQCKVQDKKKGYVEDIIRLRNEVCPGHWRKALFVKSKGKKGIEYIDADTMERGKFVTSKVKK